MMHLIVKGELGAFWWRQWSASILEGGSTLGDRGLERPRGEYVAAAGDPLW